MSYQFFNPAPVFPDLLGIELAAGGSLTFYSIGTTTPQDTWADRDKAITNANPVPLDSAARSNTPIWLDGAYTVVLKAANGTTIWTRDMTSGTDAGLTIPGLSGNTGYFLSNDGTNLIWAPVLQMPDPTGSTNQVPVTDGSGYVLQNLPEPPEPVAPNIVVDGAAQSFRAGVSDNNTKFLIQTGTGSAPASGQWTTSAAISFPVPFAGLWNVLITIRTDKVSTADSGFLPGQSVTGWTPGSASSGATVNFVLCEDDRSPPNRFNFAVPFSWTAIGVVEVEPEA